jgi:hypothetical protein
MWAQMRAAVKAGLRMVIDADGNLTTLVVRASKKKLISALDYLIPDSPQITKESPNGDKLGPIGQSDPSSSQEPLKEEVKSEIKLKEL